jgi:hypothetical protein
LSGLTISGLGVGRRLDVGRGARLGRCRGRGGLLGGPRLTDHRRNY